MDENPGQRIPRDGKRALQLFHDRSIVGVRIFCLGQLLLHVIHIRFRLQQLPALHGLLHLLLLNRDLGVLGDVVVLQNKGERALELNDERSVV